MSAFEGDGVSHVVKRTEVTPEDDGDTKVYLQFSHLAPAAGVWFLYDPDARSWGAGSGADRDHIVAFPQASIDNSFSSRQPDELTVPWPRLQMLMVRGSSAWAGEFYDDGPGDLEPGPGVRLSVSGLEPLEAGVKPIATIEEGDFVAIIDLDRYVAALTWITANDLSSGTIVRSQGGV